MKPLNNTTISLFAERDSVALITFLSPPSGSETLVPRLSLSYFCFIYLCYGGFWLHVCFLLFLHLEWTSDALQSKIGFLSHSSFHCNDSVRSLSSREIPPIFYPSTVQ